MARFYHRGRSGVVTVLKAIRKGQSKLETRVYALVKKRRRATVLREGLQGGGRFSSTIACITGGGPQPLYGAAQPLHICIRYVLHILLANPLIVHRASSPYVS